MFAKPYKLKSSNTLKNSEKKHLAQRIQNDFPAATDEKIKDIITVKSSTNCMKLILHSGDLINVYVVDGVPMLIEVEDMIIPTVGALWRVPDLIPSIAIHSPVLNKVLGGAPLYAPGVVSESVRTQRFPSGAIVSACTTDNAAAGIIGRATMSSADLLIAPMGVCLDTIQVCGDLLCKDPKLTKLERPKLGPPSYPDADSIAADIAELKIQPVKEEWPSLMKEKPAPIVNDPKVIPESPPVDPTPEETAEESVLNDTITSECSEEEEQVPTDMDALLRWCLLSFLKREGNKLELPLKTNLLYKNHLMPYCPEDRTLDVKKSSYKKMSKFLEAMQREGLLEVREVERGVAAVVCVSAAHPLVRAHRAPPPPPPHSPAPAAAPPVVRELYCVTAAVLDLFAPLRKGTALSASEVRSSLQEYVRSRNLPSQRGTVTTDPLLAKLTGKQPQEPVKWEELMSSVLGKMTASTEMRFSDGSVTLTKAKLEPVKMQVVTRSGNKKVTLVSNLESFGFELGSLAHTCQLGVAASCGVTRSAGARADQLLLQGDQTHFVAKLLIEKYGLPKKFVEGADKALNKKK